MDNLIQQGISAAKAGDRARAFELLKRATQDTTLAEQAWLGLSAIVEDDTERLFCLDNALRINPNNGPAQSKATALRQKGIFPSTPMPPKSSVANPPAPVSLSQLATPSPSMQGNARPLQLETSGAPRSQQDVSAFYKFAAIELARKQTVSVVAQKLVDQGLTPDIANRIVGETQKVLKNARANQYKKRMTRGLIWTIVGFVLTCGTLAFASNLGGKYVLFYGAIIFGIIDFLAGLVGWLSNR